MASLSLGGSEVKASARKVGDRGSIPGSGKSPGEGNGNPLQYSCLENLHGQRGLAGCSSQGCKESDMTEELTKHTIAYSKPILYIWKFLVHILLKPSLKDSEHYLTSM